MTADAPDLLGRRVVVTGMARSGRAAALALAERGASVAVIDERPADPDSSATIELAAAGVVLDTGSDGVAAIQGADLVVASPGWPPSSPALQSAVATGVPIWGEVELAWQLRGADAADWLVITGTNGKTTTVRMLAAMLAAAGHRVTAAGNVGTPLVGIVTGAERYDVLAVELSSFQLHYAPSIRPVAAAVLNLAADHLDWHETFEAYARDKARAFETATDVRVVNADDPGVVAMAADWGTARVVPFSLGEPVPGGLGVGAGALLDRAFGADADDEVRLAGVADVHPPAPHNVANALAAAALARAYGVEPAAVAAGLAGFTPDAHRIAFVTTVDGVAYIDDSKATNPHAAGASLSAYESVVWIAGGLAKGADFDALVQAHRTRLRAAVLLGHDKDVIATALQRHAPEVPVVTVVASETGPMSHSGGTGAGGAAAMREVVEAARRLARPGDTVLLAPGCASWDMFSDYGARGEAFAAAARALPGASA